MELIKRVCTNTLTVYIERHLSNIFSFYNSNFSFLPASFGVQKFPKISKERPVFHVSSPTLSVHCQHLKVIGKNPQFKQSCRKERVIS